MGLKQKNFLDITCFGKNQQPMFLKLTFDDQNTTKWFCFGKIENENNEGLSQKPNEFRCCCMDLIKEQLSKHWVDLNVETSLKL